MFKYKKIILVSLAFLAFLLIFLSFQNQFCQLRAKVLDLLSLPLKLVYYPFRELKSIFLYRATLNENLALKQELGSLRHKELICNELIAQDERLKQIQSFRNKQHFKSITANVIGRDSSNWFFGLIIDKGKHQGIKTDAGVITPMGVVGKIQEVGDFSSKVILINDPNFKVASLVQRSRQQGIVSGKLASPCSMYYLDKDSDVKIKDEVITSGLTLSFPGGFLIGTVSSVELDPQGLNKIAIIKPAVNLSNLEQVLVILDE